MSKHKRKLGKKAPVDDTKRLHLSRYLKLSQLPPIPPSMDWSKALGQPIGVMGNDKYGCCTSSAAAHCIQVWTSNTGSQITLSDAEVLDFYEVLSPGFNPQTDTNDNGATCIAALNYWRKYGIFGHKITGYVDPEPSNMTHIQASIALFGNVYIGLAMPESADTQTDAGDPWTVPASGTKRGVGVPGSWGGHCINLCHYDANYLYGISWGQIISMSWGFWSAYTEEAHTPLTQDWISKTTKLAPNGFNFNQLNSDLAAI